MAETPKGARDLLRSCERDALISDCGLFRYWLLRRWGDGPLLLFVMLNPSKADALVDDATIRRCAMFAMTHYFGGFLVVNMFAFRATKPEDLKRAGWPVGPENDKWIEWAAERSDSICVAWGAHAADLERTQVVLTLLRRAGKPLQCLGITRGGHPSHPLMLPSSRRLQPFTVEAIQEAMHG